MNSSSESKIQPAVLVLGSSALNGHKQKIACVCHGMEQRRLILEIRQRPPVSAAVSVECNDALFLGEVVGSVQSTNGLWRAEVHVEQILTGLQSLMNLRAQLLGEGVESRVENALRPVCA